MGTDMTSRLGVYGMCRNDGVHAGMACHDIEKSSCIFALPGTVDEALPFSPNCRTRSSDFTADSALYISSRAEYARCLETGVNTAASLLPDTAPAFSMALHRPVEVGHI